jgi:transketolase
MRDVFLETVHKRMAKNDKIFFLSADFGAPALDRIRNDFPERFINVGIAEQNLINVATGLALENYIVYAYAISTFLSMRAYEQIRLNLSISTQIKPINVNLIGVGAGISYDVAGPTHHCLEDLSIMRLLPNIEVFSLSDWQLAEDFVDCSIENKKPKYFRLDSRPLAQIYEKLDNLYLENGFCELREGTDICLVSTGFMTQRALAVADKLSNIGVIDVFKLKPVGEKSLFNAIKKYKIVISIEEGFINNAGLDSIIAKIIRENSLNVKFKNLGVDDKHIFDLGDRDYLHKINNIDEEGIIKMAKNIITN